jgi:hypothetical protein
LPFLERRRFGGDSGATAAAAAEPLAETIKKPPEGGLLSEDRVVDDFRLVAGAGFEPATFRL